MSTWLCQCGLLVKDGRFCPRCKWMKFDIRQQTLLTYSGSHVGYLEGGLPFLFPPDSLASHMIIVGQTGTGKTRFAQSLIAEIQSYPSLHPLKLLIIDIESTYAGVIPCLKGKVDYFDVNSLRINPFDLKDPALIRELFRESVFKGIEEEFVDLSAQMQFVLQEAIAESSNMMELIDNIRNYSRRKLTSIEKTKTALMVRLDPFLRSPLKEIFMCKKSNPDFSRLGDNHAIIDLHALDALVAYNSELRLIYNTITTYFLRKMLGRDPTDVLSNLFVADEAQLLVPKILQKVIITQSWPATEFATRLRKRGCGLLLITQSPSNLEPDIFKNSATKIAFRLQSQEDIRMIADATGFVDMAEYEYLSNVLVRLQRKQAIVCAPDHDPFLITARDFEPAPFTHSQSPAIVNIEEHLDSSKPTIELSAEEKQFLDSIRQMPSISVRQRRHMLGWDSATYTNTVKVLEDKSLLKAVTVLKGKGRPIVLYEILNERNMPGVKHRFYVQYIIEQLSKGGIECFPSTKQGPDIVIPSIKAAINVELGGSDIMGNIHESLQEYDFVAVCSDNRRVLERIKSQISEKEGKRVFVLFVWDILGLIEAKKN